MPDNRREMLVRKMVGEGTSDDDIRATLKAFDAQTPATAAPVAPERSMMGTVGEVGKGVLKGAVSSVAGIGEMAANAGLIPGAQPSAFNPAMRNPLFTRAEEATTASNTPQMVGKGMEMAAELYSPAKALVTAGAGLARRGVPLAAKMLATDTPLLTQIRTLAARKILGRVVEMAADKAPNPQSGGRLVKGIGKKVDNVIADALDELRMPDPAPGVELPPPAELPSGYTPRASTPRASAPTPTEPPQSLNAGGRLAPAAPTKTLDRELAEALMELQRPKPTLVTTPPPAELPPGYTPRTSAPGPRAVPQAPAQAPAPRQRAYFLKPAEDIAPKVQAEATAIGMDDLPTSWRSRVGDVAPTQGIKGDVLAKAFAEELASRGVSAKDAILLVSKNAHLPPGVRLQLISALKSAGGIK